MAIILKQSTASQEILLGPFLDDTDGKTAETGLTIANTDIKIWKTGGTSEASKNSGGATHIASGRYYTVLDATDTDTLGPMEINVHVSGALPVRRECIVLAANVYDSLIGGTDLLQVDVSQFGNSAGTFASGRPEVNTTHAAGTAWASGAITAASIASDAITAGKIADGAIDAATFASGALDAVWSTSARTLTALDEDSTTLDLDATIRGAVGLASANLDTQLGDIPTATENADALLNRDMSAVTDSNARSPLNALRFIRNKWSISGTTLTVTKEDDSTSAWTATVTASPGADPISGNDPT